MPIRETRWETVRLERQFDAELRTNVVRIAAVGLLYTLHLIHHYSAGGKHAWLGFLRLDDAAALPEPVHDALTAIALAWAMMAVIIHLALESRVFPRGLMYASTFADVVFLTAVLAFTSGAASPLVAVYFLIIMMAGLRLQLSLIWFTTLIAILGYLCVIGCRALGIGSSTLAQVPAVPRYHQAMLVAALALAGIVAGQSIRHVRRLFDAPPQAAVPQVDKEPSS
jgi:hypothetical protein